MASSTSIFSLQVKSEGLENLNILAETLEGLKSKAQGFEAATKNMSSSLSITKSITTETATSLQQLGQHASTATTGIGNLHGFTLNLHAPLEHLAFLAREAGTALLELGKQGAEGLIHVGTEVVSLAGDYEANMNRLKFITGATADQMTLLSSKAVEIGKTTTFSSKSAAEGMAELAQRGYNVQQVYDLITPAAKAAMTNNVSLAQAAEGLTTVLHSMGLQSTDATHALDVMSRASQMGALNFADFQKAMANVGTVAHSAHQSFEETTAALEGMVNTGMSADRASQALRFTLVSLEKPNKQAAEMFKELGINIYDASGNMLPFSTLVDEVQKKTAGMTEAQRNFSMATMFGKNGLLAMNAAMQASVQVTDATGTHILHGADALKYWTTQLENSNGTAQKATDTIMSGFNASLKNMKGSLEEAAIAVGQTLLPGLTSLVKGVTEGINKFIDFEMKTHLVGNTLKAVGDLIGAFVKPVIDAISKMVESIGNGASSMNGFMSVFESLKPIFSEIGQAIGTTIQNIVGYIQIIVEAIQSNMPAIQKLGNAIGDVFKLIGQAVGEVVKFISQNMDTFISIFTSVANIIGQIVTGIIAVFEALKPALSTVFDWIAYALGKVNEAIAIFGVAWDRAGTTVKQISFLIEMAFTQVQNWIIDAINGIIRGINTLIDGMNIVGGAVGIHIDKIGELEHAAFNAEESLNRLGLAGNDAAGGLDKSSSASYVAARGYDAAGNSANNATNAIKNLTSALGNSYTFPQNSSSLPGSSADENPEDGSGPITSSSTKASDPLQTALDLASKLADVGKKISELNSFSGVSAEALATFNGNMQQVVQDFVASAMYFNSQALKGAADYLETANKVADVIGKMADGLNKLRDYQSISYDHIQAFMGDAQIMVGAFMQAGFRFSVEMLQAAILFSSAVSQVGEAIGKMANGLSGIGKYSSASRESMYGFVGDARIIVDLFVSAGYSFYGDMLKNATLYSDAVGKVGDAIAKMANGLTALSKYSSSSQIAMYLFAQDAKIITGIFASAGYEFATGMLTNANNYSDTVGKVGDSIGKMANGLTTLNNYSSLSLQQIYFFTQDVRLVTAAFVSVGYEFNTQMLTSADGIATTTSKVADVLGKMVTGLTAVGDYGSVSIQQMNYFIEDMQTITEGFVVAGSEFNTQMLTSADGFSSTASKVADAISKGVTGLSAIGGSGSLSVQQMNYFIEDIQTITEGFVNAGNGFSTKMLASADGFSSTASKVADATGKGATELVKLNDYIPVSQQAIRDFGADLVLIVAQFVIMASQFKTDGLTAAGIFSDNASKVVDAIGKGATGFAALQGYSGIPKETMQKFIADLQIAIQLTVQMTANMNTQMFTQVQAFGEAVDKLFTGFKNAVETFTLLGDAKYTGAPEKAIRSLIAGISLTVTLAGQMADQTSKDLMAKTSQFGEAIKQIFDGLKSALDTFTGLTNMPETPADRIKTLLSGIQSAIEQMAAMNERANNLLGLALSFDDKMQRAATAITAGQNAVAMAGVPSGAPSGSSGAASGKFTGGAWMGRATGGTAFPYFMAGENGAEPIFLGAQNAYVMNNSMAQSRGLVGGNGGSTSNHQTINITLNITESKNARATGKEAKDQVLMALGQRSALLASQGGIAN